MSNVATPRFRWRRWLAGAVVVFGSLLLSLYLALATTEGTRLILRQAGQAMPLSLSGIQGNLITGVRIDHVAISLPSAQIKLQQVVINLDLWRLLFTQELRLAELAASEIAVTTIDGSPQHSDAATPSLPALPVRIVIRRIKLDALIINNETPIAVSLDRVSLINQHLLWQGLRIKRADILMSGKGSWRSDAMVQTLTSEWQWSMYGTQGQVHLDSNFDTFNARGTLAPLDTAAGPISGHIEAKGTLLQGANVTAAFSALQGQSTFQGEIHWANGLSITGHLTGTDVHLHHLPGWPLALPARADLSADISAEQTDGTLRWHLPNALLDGVLGDNPLRVEVSASGQDQDISIKQWVVRHQDSRIDIHGDIKEKHVALTVQAELPRIGDYTSHLEGDVSIQGRLVTRWDAWQDTLELDISANSHSLLRGATHLDRSSLTLRNSGKQLHVQWHSEAVHSDELALENMRHTFNGQLTAAGLQLSGEGQSTIFVAGQRLELPPLTSQWHWYQQGEQLLHGELNAHDERVTIHAITQIDRQQNLQAKADLTLASLDWISRYEPKLASIEGQADFHLSASGSLLNNEPIRMTAMFNVAAPQTQLIDPDIRFNDTVITGELMRDGHVTFNGQALQAGRPIHVSGQGQLLGNDAPTLSVTVDAERLRADTPAVNISLSPSLAVDWQPKRVKVRGKLVIPEADIAFNRLPNPSYSHSNDVIVVGRSPRQQEAQIDQDIAVQLLLKDNVVIKAAGLTTKLKGTLLYTSLSGKPIQLQGKLDLVDGNLRSQNGDLGIKQGSLIFSGNPENPAVDIIAVRKIDSPSLEVGLHLTGSLQDLRTAVVSFPAMDQSRALSYLVFGRDITHDNGASGISNAQLMSAAISLGIGQSTSLMQSLKRGTGLDELSAVANDSGSASLIAGKQINSKLYARYRYDMAEALSVLLLRYRLNQHWTLEAESGVDNAIDVLYRLGD